MSNLKSIVACVLTVAAAGAVQAQTASPAAKPDATTTAAKPHGEGPTPASALGKPAKPSDTSRAEVKSEAKDARKAGTIASGEGNGANTPVPAGPSNVSRAAVKAEAASAAKGAKGPKARGESPEKELNKGAAKP